MICAGGALWTCAIPDSKDYDPTPLDKTKLNPVKSFSLLNKDYGTLIVSIVYFFLNIAEDGK